MTALVDDFSKILMEYREELVFFFVFLAIASVPLELMLISVMKKHQPGIEVEIEKTPYGKGILGKYKAMLEILHTPPPEKWFALGVLVERWLRILSFTGFVFIILMTYLVVSG